MVPSRSKVLVEIGSHVITLALLVVVTGLWFDQKGSNWVEGATLGGIAYGVASTATTVTWTGARRFSDG